MNQQKPVNLKMIQINFYMPGEFAFQLDHALPSSFDAGFRALADTP